MFCKVKYMENDNNNIENVSHETVVTECEVVSSDGNEVLSEESHSFLENALIGVKLTLLQKFILDEYIANFGNISRTIANLKKTKGISVTTDKLKVILEYPHIKEEIARRLEGLGVAVTMSKDEWLKQTVQFRDTHPNATKSFCFFHKLIGIAVGALSSGAQKFGNNINIENQEINVIEKN